MFQEKLRMSLNKLGCKMLLWKIIFFLVEPIKRTYMKRYTYYRLIHFSSLDHIFLVHLFYLLYMQETISIQYRLHVLYSVHVLYFHTGHWCMCSTDRSWNSVWRRWNWNWRKRHQCFGRSKTKNKFGSCCL